MNRDPGRMGKGKGRGSVREEKTNKIKKQRQKKEGKLGGKNKSRNKNVKKNRSNSWFDKLRWRPAREREQKTRAAETRTQRQGMKGD